MPPAFARVVLLAAGTLLLLPGTAPAATWTPPQTLGEGARGSLFLTAAADGTVLASWGDGLGRTHASARMSTGPWAPARAIGPNETTQPSALPGGRVLMASGGVPGASSRVRAWSGRMQAPTLSSRTIGRDPWDLPVVATDPRGRAVSVWTTDTPRKGSGSNLRPRVVMFAARTASGRWSSARRISPLPPAPPYGNGLGPRLSATTATVAMGGDGVVVAAWQRVGYVEARISRDGGRSFGRVTRLGRTSFAHPRPAVAVSATGAFAVAWSTASGGDPRTLRSLIATRVRSGGFGRARTLSVGEAPRDVLSRVADQFGARVLVRYDTSGRGSVAWQSGEGDRVGVRLARINALGGGSRGSLLGAATAGAASLLTDLVSSDDRTTVAWTDTDALGRPAGALVAVRTGRGSVGRPETVSAGAVGDLRLATRAGRVTALWGENAAGGQTVRTADRTP